MVKKFGETKLFAFVAVLLSIIGFLIVLLFRRRDKYAIFYAKQSLILFIGFVLVAVFDNILKWIPIIGKGVSLILDVGIFILWIVALINSLSGKTKETPLIGKYARKIDL